ncbi:hypothetical protein AX16_010887 [Volvariella volvacea WC 439]|nr:hypothetical protein AX16_010887 [Volvariella volvacea WC 439]
MLDQRAEITHAAFNARAKRKRSIKAFLPISLTGRATSSPTAFNPKTAGSVPADVVLEIAELLAPIDVLNFSLTSKYLRTLLLPSLYETILLKSSRKCRSTLPMLAKHPEICACIRKLAVRPNYYLSWPKADDPLDEDWVVTQIEGIAPTLKGLHTFDWDGLEMPADRLWQTLQRCCPQLKTVFSNVGCKPLNPDSHLFSFKGLTSFSLIVRHGLAGTDLFPPLEHLPEQMWTMLLDHSPNLEELTLCSFSSSSRLFDIEPITQGSWPSLNTLTLGSFGYHQNFTLTPPATAPEFGAFLSAHTALKYLRLSWNFKRWMSPESIPMHLAPSALPNLDSFIGVYQQLAELPDECCKRIENLDLTCEPVYESRVQIVSPLLRRLTELKSLDVWVHVPNPEEQDHSQFFREIVGACPGLTELHFMCTTPFPAKPLKQLSTLLRLLPNLKTFSLTKGHKYRDDTMLQNALQIIRDNQNLKQVNIRWAREKSPNHLKQEGTYDVEKVVSGPGGEASVTAVAASTTTTTMQYWRWHQHLGRKFQLEFQLGALVFKTRQWEWEWEWRQLSPPP